MNCYGRIMFLCNWLPVYDYIERYFLRHSWSSFHLWKCFCWMSFNAKCAWMDVIINFCSHQCNNFSIFNNWIMYSTQKKGIISLTGVWKKALSIFFLLCLSSIIRILHYHPSIGGKLSFLWIIIISCRINSLVWLQASHACIIWNPRGSKRHHHHQTCVESQSYKEKATKFLKITYILYHRMVGRYIYI